MLKSITLFLVVSLLGCSNAVCPPTGDLVVPHEGDATKYVVCREGTELILSCDDETTYNPLTKVCESSRYGLERAPTCSPSQTVTLFFEHETSCSMFYTCAYGITNLMYCPEGLEYYPEFRHCDWPSPNGCFAHTTTPPSTESTTKTTTKGTTKPTTKGTTKPTTKGTTKPTTMGTTKTTTRGTTETTTKGTTKTTTRGTTETTTKGTTKTTTEGTTETTTKGTTEIITDPTTETTPEITSESPTDSETESTTEIITESTTESITEITSESPTDSTPTDPPVKCPLNVTDITLLPHPTKCDTFYICWYGHPYVVECEFDYEFDVALGGCVLISDSGCTASKTSTTEITTESTTVTPTEPPPTCSGPGISYVPHETNCQIYLICYDGELAYIGVCNPGYEFDLEVKDCVLISGSGCTASKTTVRNTELVTPAGLTPTFTPKCDPDTLEITIIPHPTNCQVYYVCWGGTATSISCIYDYEFDVATGKCQPISSTGCTASKTTTLVWSTSTESSSSISDDSSPVADVPRRW